MIFTCVIWHLFLLDLFVGFCWTNRVCGNFLMYCAIYLTVLKFSWAQAWWCLAWCKKHTVACSTSAFVSRFCCWHARPFSHVPSLCVYSLKTFPIASVCLCWHWFLDLKWLYWALVSLTWRKNSKIHQLMTPKRPRINHRFHCSNYIPIIFSVLNASTRWVFCIFDPF